MKKKPAKKPRLYFTVKVVIDPDTGRKMKGLVAEDNVQRMALKERGFKVGQRVAADIHPERCYAQWAKGHVLGTFLAQNVEEMFGLDAHAAIKKLQWDGDIECEYEEFDLGQLGKVSRKVAKSLSFDSMGQDVFDRVYYRMCQYAAEKYFPGMDSAQVDEMVKLMPMEPQ